MTTSDREPITDEELSEWRRLVEQAQGEDPHDTLGPTPWTPAIAKPWEDRHQHDARLSCLKVDYCAVIEQAHEAMEVALPALLDEVERLRKSLAQAERVLDNHGLLIDRDAILGAVSALDAWSLNPDKDRLS